MMVNNANLDALRVGFNASFQRGFSGTTALYTTIASVIPSSTRLNTYGWLGNFPQMRRWVGDRRVNSLDERAYTLANEDFEATISVPRKDIEDDVLGVYSPMFEGLGQSAAALPDKLVFDSLAQGHTRECFDGQNFFDTEHPVGDEAVSNITAGATPAWYLVDLSKPLKPLIYQNRKPPQFVAQDRPTDENVFMRGEYRYGVDSRGAAGFAFWQLAHRAEVPLNAESYAVVRAAMTALTDDEGEPLGVRPTHLVTGGSNLADARQLLKASTLPAGGSNIWFEDVALLEAPRLA